jgi:SAM-dependent methyltransferase
VSESEHKPAHQRPEHPDFWCKRFGDGVTPWDAGGVPSAFERFVLAQAVPLATLIPGCGSAWEAARLAALQWPVTALDFSPQAVAAARRVLDGADVELMCDDFFTFLPTRDYALIYERAFLCALPRSRWADWGKRVAELLRPGGLLAGFFVSDQLTAALTVPM